MRRFALGRRVCPLLILLVVLAPATLTLAQTQPLPTCTIEQVQAAFQGMVPYTPGSSLGWITAQENGLTVNGAPFYVTGVNYYPANAPWRRFLTQSSLSDIDRELRLIASTGFNTIRIYLWNEALFTCPGSGVVPVPSAFTRLDAVIQSAARYGLHVLVTLNDMPDLDNQPLYTSPESNESQTAFIVNRYRNEPAILGWDMRNAGDLDYGSETNFEGKFQRQVVLNWLAATRNLIRSLDSRHLITAGWAFDVEATAPYVDFISFAHWAESPAALQDRVRAIQRVTDKPIVLSAFGFASFERSEEEQARLLTAMVSAVEESDAAGWIVWTAFDFPTSATCVEPNCPSPDNREHHFGLWRTDYSPKPALSAIAAG